MAADTGKISPSRRELAPGEDVVDQEAVDAAVAVLEGVQKHEPVRHGGGMHHRVDVARVHAPWAATSPSISPARSPGFGQTKVMRSCCQATVSPT